MKSSFRTLFLTSLLLVSLFLVPSANAFVRIIFQPEGTTLAQDPPSFMFWDISDIDGNSDGRIDKANEGVPITFRVAPNSLSNADVDNILVPAFSAWDSNATSFISIQEQARTSEAISVGVTTDSQGNVLLNDNINLVTIVEESDSLNSSIFGAPSAGLLALTFPFARGQDPANVGQASPGRLLDADILFNGAFFGPAASEPGTADLQGVATHEFGHLIGLNHTFVRDFTFGEFTDGQQVVTLAEDLDDFTPTMWSFPLFSEGNNLGVNERTLESDDLAGASALYSAGGFANRTARISGRAFDAGTLNAIFGGHAVAYRMDEDLERPVQVIGNLTGASEGNLGSSSGGSYLIEGLDPADGPYFVVLEPIDPARPSLDGVSVAVLSIFFPDQGIDTDFNPMIYVTGGAQEISNFDADPTQGGTPLNLVAGGERAGINFGPVPIEGPLNDPIIGTLALLGVISDFLNATTVGDSSNPGLGDLRRFRDRGLLQIPAGDGLTEIYYGLQPDVGRWIANQPNLQESQRHFLGLVAIADDHPIATLLALLGGFGLVVGLRRYCVSL